MATHAYITAAPLRAPLSPRFQLANRTELEQEIERLIELLDAADGDCDLEDDDPAGTTIDQGEAVGDHGRGLLPDRLIYTLDQSNGPTNYAEASRGHHAREAGLIRSSTGGWRKVH